MLIWVMRPSASKDRDGAIHVSLCNIDMKKNRSVEIDLRSTDKLSKSSVEIITTTKENDYNDFGQSERVNIKKFSSFSVKNNILKVDLPAKSVATIELKK